MQEWVSRLIYYNNSYIVEVCLWLLGFSQGYTISIWSRHINFLFKQLLTSSTAFKAYGLKDKFCSIQYLLTKLQLEILLLMRPHDIT